MPSHFDSQQTPSVQLEDAHSSATLQAVPSFFEQRPSLPAALQREPLPQVAEPQQTPSVQNKPSRQSVFALQVVPSPTRGTHAPLLHVLPAAHWSSDVHEVEQELPPHAYAPHAEGMSEHLPLPSQVEPCVSTPSLQVAAPHATVPADA
jgi:hypothetical protein